VPPAHRPAHPPGIRRSAGSQPAAARAGAESEKPRTRLRAAVISQMLDSIISQMLAASRQAVRSPRPAAAAPPAGSATWRGERAVETVATTRHIHQ